MLHVIDGIVRNASPVAEQACSGRLPGSSWGPCCAWQAVRWASHSLTYLLFPSSVLSIAWEDLSMQSKLGSLLQLRVQHSFSFRPIMQLARLVKQGARWNNEKTNIWSN